MAKKKLHKATPVKENIVRQMNREIFWLDVIIKLIGTAAVLFAAYTIFRIIWGR